MIEYILFVLGIVLLIKGADLLVDGSSSLAKKIKIPTLIIGLTVVAFGTTIPELTVNVFSAIKGSTDVAFGNIIGSNIANILLVLGLTAVIYPIKVKHSTRWKEIPFALLAAIILFIVSNYIVTDKMQINSLTRISGLILLCFFAVFIYYIISVAKKSRSHLKSKKMKISQRKNYIIALMILLGLVGLYFGGRWTVGGAVFIASQFGLSQFLISATIIAFGTSLPELFVGVTAALKKETDIAIGNCVGANILNILWILGITALIAPIIIPSYINADMLFLIFITLLLFLFTFIGKKHELNRKKGILFLVLYVAYITFIIIRG